MPAPKGNKFALGNSGTSKMFEDVDELQEAINTYFRICDVNKLGVDKHGADITEPYTIEGLALALGCSTETLRNYEKAEGYEEYFATIRDAKQTIAKQKVVNGLIGKSNATFAIFDLKNNHGYKDKTEVENTNIEQTPIFKDNGLSD